MFAVSSNTNDTAIWRLMFCGTEHLPLNISVYIFTETSTSTNQSVSLYLAAQYVLYRKSCLGSLVGNSGTSLGTVTLLRAGQFGSVSDTERHVIETFRSSGM